MIQRQYWAICVASVWKDMRISVMNREIRTTADRDEAMCQIAGRAVASLQFVIGKRLIQRRAFLDRVFCQKCAICTTKMKVCYDWDEELQRKHLYRKGLSKAEKLVEGLEISIRSSLIFIYSQSLDTR